MENKSNQKNTLSIIMMIIAAVMMIIGLYFLVTHELPAVEKFSLALQGENTTLYERQYSSTRIFFGIILFFAGALVMCKELKLFSIFKNKNTTNLKEEKNSPSSKTQTLSNDTNTASNNTIHPICSDEDVEKLLIRIHIFLEDGNWQHADEYCERVLDSDPQNAKAYLCKLMAEFHCSEITELKNCAQPFDDSNNYKKILRYGDEELIQELQGYIDIICQRNEEQLKADQEKQQAELEQNTTKWLTELEERKKKNKKKTIIITSIVLAIITSIVLWVQVVTPSIKYNRAVELAENGYYYDSTQIFLELGDYKDSEDKAIQYCPIGGSIYFSSSEWIVLDRQEDKVLLLSKYAVDDSSYHYSYDIITWENCSLRKSLNEDYLENCFTPEEQERILPTVISNPDNMRYDTEGGNDTTDKIFLLSIAEAKNYFDSNYDRRLKVSQETQDYYFGDDSDCAWWLRSPGVSGRQAACVDSEGEIDSGGKIISIDRAYVRPAMWISIK